MDSRLTANFGPSMVSPGLRLSNAAVMISLPRVSLRPDGPATARTNHLAMLVEEDIVVHHVQPLALDELVERAGLKPDDVAGTRRNMVAPGLSGIDGARAAHPVVGRRAGEHQEDVDRRRRDQPAVTGGPGVSFIEIDRVIFADRPAVQRNRLLRQRIGNGLTRLAGNDVVPDLSQIGMLPEVGLEGLRLPHLFPPAGLFLAFYRRSEHRSAGRHNMVGSGLHRGLPNSLYSIINLQMAAPR